VNEHDPTLGELRAAFVLSTGRVGTATLAEVLGSLPGVKAVHEPQPFLLPESAAAYAAGGWNAPMDQGLAAAVLAARERLWRPAAERGLVYVETANRLTYLARPLDALLPRSCFIHLHRHPADVIRSAMRRGYYAGHSWDRWRIRPRKGSKAAATWPSWTSFERCCWYWDAVNREALSILDDVPDRCLDLASVDLFENASGTVARLGEFLGLDVPLPAVDAVPRANVQEDGSFPLLAEWEDPMLASVEQICGETARRLGYDINRISSRA
jgi:hypothetical protein